MVQETGVLPDHEIEALVAEGAIRSDLALEAGQVQPASLDLRLPTGTSSPASRYFGAGKPEKLNGPHRRIHPIGDEPGPGF